MQADRGFVEDVHHPDESRTDLAREAYAPPLSAGQRIGGAIEREVVEAHVDEEVEALAHLLHDPPRDLPPVAGECRLAKEAAKLGHRELGEIGQGSLLHVHRAGVAVEPRPAAGGARPRAHEPGQLLAHVGGVGLAVAPLHVRDDPFEGPESAVPGSVVDFHRFVAAAVENGVANVARQLAEGAIEVEPVVRRERAQQAEAKGVRRSQPPIAPPGRLSSGRETTRAGSK